MHVAVFMTPASRPAVVVIVLHVHRVDVVVLVLSRGQRRRIASSVGTTEARGENQPQRRGKTETSQRHRRFSFEATCLILLRSPARHSHTLY